MTENQSTPDGRPLSGSWRAQWVFPINGEPMENATVVVCNGRIVEVHARHDPQAVDLGWAALIPGLVNAHTHLEFSDLRQPVEPAAPFTEWIRSLVALRRGRTVPPAESIRLGLDESLHNGTTLLGEIATEGWSPAVWTADSPRAVVFRELLGFDPAQVPGQLAAARDHLQAAATGFDLGIDLQHSNHGRQHGPSPALPALGQSASSSTAGPALPGSEDMPAVSVATEAARMLAASATGAAARGSDPPIVRGLSPHAPYSVHPDLYHGLVELAAAFNAPLAVHLAETQAELEFLARGTGEFARLLDDFGLPHAGVVPPGSRPLDYLRPLERLERALIVHGNYLSAEEIDFLAGRSNLSVVYCPRTHAYFGHQRHPWRELLDRGVNTALGTDSRGSNPDLSLWRELLFLRQAHPEVSPHRLLQMGTLNGARALGQENETGSLTAGKRADLTLVSLPAERTPGLSANDPYALLFHPAGAARPVGSRERL